MPKINDDIFETLADAPWWVSVAVSFCVFMGLRFILPALVQGSPFCRLGGLCQVLARWIALAFLIPGAISAFRSFKRGELLKGQTSISAVRSLSWRAFEELVGEAYRRHGYSVTGNSGPGADGGVDIVARKDGETTLIQCKQWRGQQVGVRIVREMFGLLHAERADHVHIVTTGSFTDEAKEFAQGKPILLIDGPLVLEFVKVAQSQTLPTLTNPQQKMVCPQCGSDMVVRTARTGSRVGNQFWGCVRFPSCQGTRAIG